MPIVSVSVPGDLVVDMDRAIAERAYKGRSEFVRAAVRSHLGASAASSALGPSARGHVHGSITILYAHDREARISEVRHAFHDVVLSLMHTHCEAETCMDVLIVGGPPQRVQELHATLLRMRDVQRCSLAVMA